VLTTVTVGGNTNWGGTINGLGIIPDASGAISVDNIATTGGAVLNRAVVLK
jgi:hypothetical protein